MRVALLTREYPPEVYGGAGATVAAIPVSRQDAKAFGILDVASDGRTIEKFLEKPANPPPMPGSTERDFGYWRDVGTIDAYFDAHMDLRTVDPMFNLYNYRWPILTHVENLPPAKFVHDTGDRVGRAIDSLVSNGVIVSGGLVRECVLSPGVRVNSWATVEGSVLLQNTVVGRHAEIRKAIIDKNVIVPEGAKVGVDKEHDKARGFVVSPAGITVVGKGQVITS